MRTLKQDFFHRKAFQEYWRLRNAADAFSIVLSVARMMDEEDEQWI